MTEAAPIGAWKPSVSREETIEKCGAPTRRGTPCRRKALANGRCPTHGGLLSIGPKTERGQNRIAAAAAIAGSQALVSRQESKLGHVVHGDGDGTCSLDPSDFQNLDAGETPNVTFTYQVDDSNGGPDTAIVADDDSDANDVAYKGSGEDGAAVDDRQSGTEDIATCTVTNDGPVANDVTFTGPAEGGTAQTFAHDASDVDGDTLTYAINAQSSEGDVIDSERGSGQAFSDMAEVLVPLLNALGWRGNLRALAEALPHLADTLDIEGLRDVLANLNYKTAAVRVSLAELDSRLLPCLFMPDGGPAMVVLGRDRQRINVIDSGSAKRDTITVEGLTGTAYLIAPVERPDDGHATPHARDWSATVARRFRGLIWQMFGITFFISLTALAVPLFILSVYDRVIPGQSTNTLACLVIGAILAVGMGGAFRRIRARILAYIGGRIDMILGAHAFQQILHLPVIMTERAPIGAQISRLRQFEAVREFFTGPLASVFLELPFVPLFLVVIAAIAGPLALIPVALIVVFALLAVMIAPIMQRAMAESSEARSRRQSFLVEMLSNLRTIKNSSAEPVWSRRHRELTARCAFANFRTAQISGLSQTLAHLLVLSAGIAAVTFGAMRVLDNEMTIGALVASMILIWRVLAPLQTGFLSLTRLEQVRLGLRQMNLLMKMRREREPGVVVDRYRTFKGEIAFNRVSLRYTPQGEPALLGAEFKVKPGQIVAITGSNGSGKSTVCKLVAGLYRPQAGAVMIDGIDIRQLDCAELRHAVAYVPQICNLFHGSIAQNLRLANPTASDATLTQAALDAGLMEDIKGLPDNFETRLTDGLQRRLPNGFKQRLMLARAYVKEAPIYVLDEPAKNLDNKGDADLMRKLQKLRGKATVLINTQRPCHMRLADKIIYLDAGRVLLDGPPDEILPRLK